MKITMIKIICMGIMMTQSIFAHQQTIIKNKGEKVAIDINRKAKIYTYDEFKKLNKLPLLVKDNKIFEYLNEVGGNIALIEEDIEIKNNLEIDYLFDYKDIQLIWFSGNVKIGNSLYIDELSNYSRSIVFEKSFESNNIIMGGIEVTFLGDVKVHQILYFQIHAEGFLNIKKAKNRLINIQSESQLYQKDSILYDFSEMSESLIEKNIDNIFLEKELFFMIDKDYEPEDETDSTIHYYEIQDDGKLVKSLLDGKQVFQIN